MKDFIEYSALQPFGQERDNWHAAIIAQLIAAVHTPKNRRPPRVMDFMYRDEESRRDSEVRETLDWLRVMKHGKSGEANGST